MEFLERIGEFFAALIAGFERSVTRLFGTSNERQVRRLGFVRDRSGKTIITPGSVLAQINALEPELEKLSDDELRGTAARLRAKLAAGKTLNDILPEAFAAVRESGKRYLKMRHYDVQMIGGWALHNGMIAEMVTGEGKTLVSTLPAFLNALAGQVHVVTVNDYLARRDMEWMAPLHMGLGLTINCIQAHQDPDEKAAAYQCDITYGTNNEFGFDYLRDNMRPARRGDEKYRPHQRQVQGPLDYAIVDEIDNILIDEARTPLIISGPAQDDVSKYKTANQVALQLKKGVDFEVKEKEHTCHLTDEGIRRAEELAGVESFYTAGNMEWPHLIDNALKAHHLYKRDVEYVVQKGEIIIVDEFTGRLMIGRNWSDGLHQAVEAKEGVRVKEENQTLATITLQNYFKLYKKLSGMTGTAMTEAGEFWKIYKLDVVAIPTNRPMQRINYQDVVFGSEREKFKAIADEIDEIHKEGRPILVGTVSIEKSEHLSDLLTRRGVKHEVLNAKHHEREADIIAQAGRLNAVTIATNMAGRGTDIILGGNPDQMAWEQLKTQYASRIDVPKSVWDALTKEISTREGMAAEGRKVAELGGLHVIGSERHDARRIDLQLRGRSGRQGDPGSSRFFLSLEDPLMRIFGGDWVKGWLEWAGMQEGEAIESRMVSKRIEAAQKKREEMHFEQRKHLLEYDEVMDQQRKRVYTYRQNILDGGNCRTLIMEMFDKQLREDVPDHLSPLYGPQTVAKWVEHEYHIRVEDPRDLRDMEAPAVADLLRARALDQAEEALRDKIEEDIPEEVDDPRDQNWAAFTKWVNVSYRLNLNERDVRKIPPRDLYEQILPQIEKAIERYEFAPLDIILAPEFGRRQLAGKLKAEFTVEINPEQLEGLTQEEAIKLIRGKIEELYARKEVEFPVSVALHRYLAERAGQGGERYDREGLASWASGRFGQRLAATEFEGKSRHDIKARLEAFSRQFHRNGDLLEQADKLLDQAYDGLTGSPPSNPQALVPLTSWAEGELHVKLQPDQLQTLPKNEVRRQIEQTIEERYRPELCQAERQLILEVLDASWKDHLYFMDHLRQGIGLAGYAGKDPKVEYRKEGMKAFEEMWKQISRQVTGVIFRLEESPAFDGGMWQITSTTHEEAQSTEELAAEVAASQPDAPPEAHPTPGDRPIEPIRNFGKRVGRNDPCPCNSGKKYKNCCME